MAELTISPHKSTLTLGAHYSGLAVAAHKSTLTLESIDIYTYLNFIAPWQFIEIHTEVGGED